jgi:6-phosphogluconolactonase
MRRDDKIVILSDVAAVADEAARRFATLAEAAVAARGRFSAALSGGSTPGALYRRLAGEPYRSEIPWSGVHFFWSDERCMPPDDSESNYRLADSALLSHVPIVPDQVHRILGEMGPERAAHLYELALHDFFCGPLARFDLVLLGLGEDGHVASLFPGSAALLERERLAVAAEARYQDRPAQRVTLTLPAINSAREILFLVTGRAKAGIVQTILEGPDTGLPAQLARPTAGRVTWLLDGEAGRSVKRKA